MDGRTDGRWMATLAAARLPSALTCLCSRDPRCHGDWQKQGRRSSASSSLLFLSPDQLAAILAKPIGFFFPGPRGGPASCTVSVHTCTPAHVSEWGGGGGGGGGGAAALEQKPPCTFELLH